MKTIWKFEIDFDCWVSMPAGSDVLSVQMQDRKPQLWAVVDPSAIAERRHFLMIGTGHSFDGQRRLQYIATVQDGPFVWHVFEEVRV